VKGQIPRPEVPISRVDGDISVGNVQYLRPLTTGAGDRPVAPRQPEQLTSIINRKDVTEVDKIRAAAPAPRQPKVADEQVRALRT